MNLIVMIQVLLPVAVAVAVAPLSFATAPTAREIYSSPFQCSTEAYSALAVKGQNLDTLSDYRVMREQTEIFIACVNAALRGRAAQWQSSHPYALMRDLYQIGLPYLQPSAALFARLGQEEVNKGFDAMDVRMSEFLKPLPGQGPVPADAETRELKKWLKSLRKEVKEQLSRDSSSLALVSGDLAYGKKLWETSQRFYAPLKRKLCAWKLAVDSEFKAQTVDSTQTRLPSLPPQIIYCP